MNIVLTPEELMAVKFTKEDHDELHESAITGLVQGNPEDEVTYNKRMAQLQEVRIREKIAKTQVKHILDEAIKGGVIGVVVGSGKINLIAINHNNFIFWQEIIKEVGLPEILEPRIVDPIPEPDGEHFNGTQVMGCSCGHQWIEVYELPMAVDVFVAEVRKRNKCPKCGATKGIGFLTGERFREAYKKLKEVPGENKR